MKNLSKVISEEQRRNLQALRARFETEQEFLDFLDEELSRYGAESEPESFWEAQLIGDLYAGEDIDE